MQPVETHGVLRQGTERVVEANTVLTLLEESLQAAQDQRRASCSQELPSRLMSEGRLPDGHSVIYAPILPGVFGAILIYAP